VRPNREGLNPVRLSSPEKMVIIYSALFLRVHMTGLMKYKIVSDVFDTSDNYKTLSYVFDARNKLRNSMLRF